MVCGTQSQAFDNHEHIGEGREIQRADRIGKIKVNRDLREKQQKETEEVRFCYHISKRGLIDGGET